MLNQKAINNIPTWKNLDGQKVPFIVFGRKQAYWQSGETGHFSTVCPVKNWIERVSEGFLHMP